MDANSERRVKEICDILKKATAEIEQEKVAQVLKFGMTEHQLHRSLLDRIDMMGQLRAPIAPEVIENTLNKCLELGITSHLDVDIVRTTYCAMDEEYVTLSIRFRGQPTIYIV